MDTPHTQVKGSFMEVSDWISRNGYYYLFFNEAAEKRLVKPMLAGLCQRNSSCQILLLLWGGLT